MKIITSLTFALLLPFVAFSATSLNSNDSQVGMTIVALEQDQAGTLHCSDKSGSDDKEESEPLMSE